MLAALYAKEKLLQGKAVRFMTTAGLLNQLRRNITGDWNQRMDRYQKSLPDPGRSGHRQSHRMGAGRLFLLIDARYTARRQTIFTSNFSLPELQAKLLDAKGRIGKVGPSTVSSAGSPA